MADSENSRTLPVHTPLNILSCTADFLRTADAAGQDPDADPAMVIWRAWNDAHREFALLCRMQQHLETQLIETVGFPHIKVEIPGRPDPVVLRSEADIEYCLKGPELASARDKARQDLARRLSAWNTADRVTGYTRARDAEGVAADRERALAAELWSMPATSIKGAIAKLHVVLTLGIASPDCDEFPWPPLRALLNDLTVLCEPDVSSVPELALSVPRR